MSILSVLAELTGCGNISQAPAEPQPIAFPEGTELTGFYMTHQGMAMEPHYIYTKTAEGGLFKITNLPPDDWRLPEDIPVSYDEPWYFRYADRVCEAERASLVTAEEASVEKLCKAIEDSGALGWDGYKKSVSKKGVRDSGDAYVLYMCLDDGTTVTVDSYNSRPDGWNDLMSAVRDLFEETADYSAYED